MINDKEELYDKCENIEQLYDNYYLPLAKEKQDLIKYLEDMRRELKYNIYKFDSWHELGEDIHIMMAQVEIYQKILDRIKEGNYE